VFGLDNAGKTALIASMGGNPDKETTPTVGFSPVMCQTDKYDICIFDLGGGATFRGIWQHYYHDCHGVIYVVDSSDEARIQESANVFAEMVNHKYIAKKPLLVFANKVDKAGPNSADHVSSLLRNAATNKLPSQFKVVSSCAIEQDKNVDDGVDWILQTIASSYESIQSLIKTHSVEVKEEKKKRLAEQQKRVDELRLQDAAENK